MKKKSNKKTTTEETDKEGGVRSVTDQTKEEEVVIIKNGNEETPVVVQTKKPEIRGVLVVAQGVDNVQIKKTIIEAVTRVLDVPSHRVAVAPKKKRRIRNDVKKTNGLAINDAKFSCRIKCVLYHVSTG
ncbi:hypothetical protein BsIDN1_42600 [Bacillus safensis]|uniref:Stage III sporulation protein AG n=1 Tax=Bacillus safensis TaxID=561879 RepID=A0A5S9MDH8_BACIA|nr:hypothetical protein BsIDN1_42600 [Bacillus safensis]